jgi:pyruvate formate-lyase/glycerol dehydratase family glycyl radical enzyme
MATAKTSAKAPKTAEPKIEPGKILLEEVYKTNGLTPRVQILKQRVRDQGVHIAGERAKYHLESYLETEGQHPAIRRAKAEANLFAKVPIFIRDGELIVGKPTPFNRGAYANHSMAPDQTLFIIKQRSTMASAGSEAQDAGLTDETVEDIRKAAEYWSKMGLNKKASEVGNAFAGGLRNKFGQSRLNMGGVTPSGEQHPLVLGCDFEKYLGKGVNAVITEIEKRIEEIRRKGMKTTPEDNDKIAQLEAMIISQKGFLRFVQRHAELAREMAAKESNPQRKQELLEIAKACEWVPANPARNFREALQAYWFIPVAHDMEKAISNHYAARFDQYMFPYYMKDINEGRLTRQEAAELMGNIFVFWDSLEPFLFAGLAGKRDHQAVAQANYIVNVTLGGIDRRGRPCANEFSCLVLNVAGQLRTHQPHISIRYHHAIEPEFIDAAIECNINHGAGIPAWFNDRNNIEWLISRGVSHEDAWDWSMAGCVNTAYGKTFAWTHGPGPGFVHHAKVLQMALNRGVDPDSKMKLGPDTGDPREFKTFEDVLEAYKQQVIYNYDVHMNLFKEMHKYVEQESAYMPFASAWLEGCIENATDLSRGGDKYYMEIEGGHFVDRAISDTADCLIALKRAVFEDKICTMDEMLKALEANFEGYEDLRKKLMDYPKYGNDIEEPDEMMAYLWSWTRDKALAYRDHHGRAPILFRQGAAWAQWVAPVTGALPNGRKKGEPLADGSLSPVRGCDKSGPTAVLNSAAKCDMAGMQSSLLNMKFSAGVLKTKEGKKKFAALLDTYFAKGGSQVQLNILNKDTLLDAKKHPENYQDLVVRVAGYSAYWVELTPEVRDEIISRTDHSL